ncbi:MAG: hypothetical protein AB2L11_06600 [Syntrophobacteraceae bacterium]
MPGIHGRPAELPETPRVKNLMSSPQKNLVEFSRVLTMLLNRATIYNSDHPYVQHSIDDFHSRVEQILKSISPLVFLRHGDSFFIDEEPLPSVANVGRIVSHFNKTGIQSISFEDGLDKKQIKNFLDVFTSVDTHPNADAMIKALAVRGVKHMKINQVVFKKVTQEDQVISREALKALTPKMLDEDDGESKKLFLDLVLSRLLEEELRETLTIENLLKDPAALSKKMTAADLAGIDAPGVEGGRPGLVLMRELEIFSEELDKNLVEKENRDLPEIAAALFEMKKRLMEGIEAEKSLNIQYSNEAMILDKANEITDSVLLRIVKYEYKAGKTSVSRLAQIVRRLVPESSELKRLLPKIRSALLEEGMSLADYLHLVQEIGKELQSEDLANILQESSEEIGVDGETLIEEIKKNPVQAAELIYLAAEIRNGSGDEQTLSDLLVDYVERLASKLTTDIGENSEAEGEQHLRHVLSSIESGIVGQLKGMDCKDDFLERIEERFNDRIDSILERVKLDWIRSHSETRKDDRKQLSVLELFEQSVIEGDELGDIITVIRDKVRSGEIDENNFAQIYAEIVKQQSTRSQEMKERMPKGVLEAPILTLLIEKEIARANRYGLPFSTLSFSLVKAVSKSTSPSAKISYQRFVPAIFQIISNVIRDADIIGELGKNRIVVLLPMTSGTHAQLALKRYLKKLHSTPVNVDGATLEIRLAGVATAYDAFRTPNIGAFVQALTDDLAQMERRIRNLQTYF